MRLSSIIFLALFFILGAGCSRGEKSAASVVPQQLAVKSKIFIGKPAKDVWAALTEENLVNQYYLVPLIKLEQKVGGEIAYGIQDELVVYGKVIEIQPGKLLKHSFNYKGTAADPETTVIYKLTDMGQMTLLEFSHEGFPAENQTYANVSGGWPVILSGLKTLLETGAPLPWPKQG